MNHIFKTIILVEKCHYWLKSGTRSEVAYWYLDILMGGEKKEETLYRKKNIIASLRQTGEFVRRGFLVITCAMQTTFCNVMISKDEEP